MTGVLLIVGIIFVLLGSGAILWLPSAPSSIQTNRFLQPIGSFLINKGSQVALVGLAMIVAAVFFFKGRG